MTHIPEPGSPGEQMITMTVWEMEDVKAILQQGLQRKWKHLAAMVGSEHTEKYKRDLELVYKTIRYVHIIEEKIANIRERQKSHTDVLEVALVLL